MAPFARAVLLAHWAMAVVSVLLLIAFLPSLGAPRVPVLYGLMYGGVRWALLALEFYAVPALFVAMVFALTGPTRWGLKEAMRTSVNYKRVIVWSWVLMLGAWFLVLAIATGGRA
jgi:hypothetical protein